MTTVGPDGYSTLAHQQLERSRLFVEFEKTSRLSMSKLLVSIPSHTSLVQAASRGHPHAHTLCRPPLGTLSTSRSGRPLAP